VMQKSLGKLLEKLKVLELALPQGDLVPELSCFFFTGKRIVASDKSVFASTRFNSDFVGGLRGSTLLKYFSSVSG